MRDNSKNKKIEFEYKIDSSDLKTMKSIITVRNRILIEMTYKILINKTKHEKAG